MKKLSLLILCLGLVFGNACVTTYKSHNNTTQVHKKKKWTPKAKSRVLSPHRERTKKTTPAL